MRKLKVYLDTSVVSYRKIENIIGISGKDKL